MFAYALSLEERRMYMEKSWEEYSGVAQPKELQLTTLLTDCFHAELYLPQFDHRRDLAGIVGYL